MCYVIKNGDPNNNLDKLTHVFSAVECEKVLFIQV